MQNLSLACIFWLVLGFWSRVGKLNVDAWLLCHTFFALYPGAAVQMLESFKTLLHVPKTSELPS